MINTTGCVMPNAVPFVSRRQLKLYAQAIRWMAMGAQAEADFNEWLLQAPEHVEVTLNVLTVDELRAIAIEGRARPLIDSDADANFRDLTEGRTEEERGRALGRLARWYAEQSLKLPEVLRDLRSARLQDKPHIDRVHILDPK